MEAEIAHLAAVLAASPEIVAAYLFGSAAKGRLRPDSDLDVAVLLDPASPGTDTLRLRIALARDLEQVAGRRADVVVLNAASPSFRYSVYRTGRALFERDPAAAHLFRARSLSEWYDFEPAQTRAFRVAMARARREAAGCG